MGEMLAVALAQVNAATPRGARAARRRRGHDLVVRGELALAGYPPEDFVLKRVFQDPIEAAAHALPADTADGGPPLLVGAPGRQEKQAAERSTAAV